MYHPTKPDKTTIVINESYEGERIEEKVTRITVNKEPITDGAAEIYTDRAEGVKPEYNIRTDRWEIANEAMELVSKTETAKREKRIKDRAEKEKIAKGETIQGDGAATPQ